MSIHFVNSSIIFCSVFVSFEHQGIKMKTVIISLMLAFSAILMCYGDITAKGRKCDPNAPNGLHKCAYHGLNVDVSPNVAIENRISCMTNATTGKMGYCCADACKFYINPWNAKVAYYWCRVTDRALGLRWNYCKRGVPYY